MSPNPGLAACQLARSVTGPASIGRVELGRPRRIGATMHDDWRTENGLASLRAKIYTILPADWMFYGPIKGRDGSWGVGGRPTNGPVEAGRFAVHRDLGSAFRLLADAIRARHLPPGLSN
jgi:hypothetical protein